MSGLQWPPGPAKPTKATNSDGQRPFAQPARPGNQDDHHQAASALQNGQHGASGGLSGRNGQHALSSGQNGQQAAPVLQNGQLGASGGQSGRNGQHAPSVLQNHQHGPGGQHTVARHAAPTPT